MRRLKVSAKLNLEYKIIIYVYYKLKLGCLLIPNKQY